MYHRASSGYGAPSGSLRGGPTASAASAAPRDENAAFPRAGAGPNTAHKRLAGATQMAGKAMGTPGTPSIRPGGTTIRKPYVLGGGGDENASVTPSKSTTASKTPAAAAGPRPVTLAGRTPAPPSSNNLNPVRRLFPTATPQQQQQQQAARATPAVPVFRLGTQQRSMPAPVSAPSHSRSPAPAPVADDNDDDWILPKSVADMYPGRPLDDLLRHDDEEIEYCPTSRPGYDEEQVDASAEPLFFDPTLLEFPPPETYDFIPFPPLSLDDVDVDDFGSPPPSSSPHSSREGSPNLDHILPSSVARRGPLKARDVVDLDFDRTALSLQEESDGEETARAFQQAAEAAHALLFFSDDEEEF
ncbi:hypothetical protein H9P43_005531 [Blastocladiella emersonii ATCC 22665]|nr:hypothetical protein H9P43_005531 [Blastocladiella emersonii ATCC 22665]